MKKFVFVTLFFAFTFLFGANKVLACSCSTPDGGRKSLQQKVKNEFLTSAYVFSGEVIEITKHPIYQNQIIVKFKVEKIWKGKSSQEVLVTTANDSAACGYDRFIVGNKYLVYTTYGEINNLTTNICSRTNLLENNKDLKFLDNLKILWESKKPIKF
ncbi:MAG: hypothetical protein K1X72_20200 [Pyrinomonadaceae bacterium]|nr:hypothetical protein [Pyrinomonadaceae bacterium]